MTPAELALISSPPSTTPFRIMEFPGDLLHSMCSYLIDSDKLNFSLANKTINAAMGVSYNHKISEISSFVQKLIQNLNGEMFGWQRAYLEGISSPLAVNYSQFKPVVLRMEDQLVDVIKTLDKETINRLKTEIEYPESMEKIFKLSAVYRRLDKVNRQPDDAGDWRPRNWRDYALKEIATHLARLGKINKADDVATSISTHGIRQQARCEIIGALRDAGKPERGLDMAMALPETWEGPMLVLGSPNRDSKWAIVSVIALRYLDNGDSAMAIDITERMPRDAVAGNYAGKNYRELVLQRIAEKG